MQFLRCSFHIFQSFDFLTRQQFCFRKIWRNHTDMREKENQLFTEFTDSHIVRFLADQDGIQYNRHSWTLLDKVQGFLSHTDSREKTNLNPCKFHITQAIQFMLKNGIVSWKDFKALFSQGRQTSHCYKAMQAVQGIGSQIS